MSFTAESGILLLLDYRKNEKKLARLAQSLGIAVANISEQNLDTINIDDFNEKVIIPEIEPQHLWPPINNKKEALIKRLVDSGREIFLLSGKAVKSKRPYQKSLSPEEQLRRLIRAPQDQSDWLTQYANDLDLYIHDTHDDELKAHLSQQLSTASNEIISAAWKQTMDIILEAGRIRLLHDLVLVLLPKDQRPCGRDAVSCILRGRYGTMLTQRPLLMLYHAGGVLPVLGEDGDGDPCLKIIEVEYYSNTLLEKPQEACGLWQIDDVPDTTSGFDYKLRITSTDCVADAIDTSIAINSIISTLLSQVLIYGRPLRHYGCTFLLPLDLDGQLRMNTGPVMQPYIYGAYPSRDTLTDYECCEAQSYLFFPPIIRELLYETKSHSSRPDALKPLKEWRLPKESWSLALGSEEQRQSSDPLLYITANISDVRLYCYFNGLYQLAISVEPKAMAALRRDPHAATLFSEGNDWWWSLAFTCHDTFQQIQQLQIAAWLHFTRLTRLLYPTFTEQTAEQKIAKLKLTTPNNQEVIFDTEETANCLNISTKMGSNFSPVVKYLLSCFFKDNPPTDLKKLSVYLADFDRLYDDRMMVNVTYGMSGAQPAKKEQHKLYSLALFVDRPSDTWNDFNGYAYDKGYLKPRLDKASLHIWEGKGLRYGYTEFSNVYLGFGEFFSETIAPKHVAYIYERMLIIVLFYQASLQRYTRQITDETNQLVAGNKKAFKDLRAEFIRFTNQYWFHDLTTAMQGKEIFSLQQKALGLTRDYDFIKDEMERADEYCEAKQQSRIATHANTIAIVGIPLALLALWLTFLPVLKDKQEILQQLCNYLPVSMLWLTENIWITGLILPLVASLVLWTAYLGCKKLYQWIRY